MPHTLHPEDESLEENPEQKPPGQIEISNARPSQMPIIEGLIF
jgi:hypothetical protein